MSNTFITPQLVARYALASYQHNSVLPYLCSRTYVDEFGGGTGDTITIRKQAKLTASLFDRQAGVQAQDVTEGSLTLTVGDLYDVSAIITQEQWQYDIYDFGFEVAEPMGKAMALRAEKVVAEAIQGQATSVNPAVPVSAAGKELDAIIEGRKVLTDAEVPMDNRVLAVGTGWTASLLKNENLIRADFAGDADALRNARIGRLFNMDVYESSRLDSDKAFIMHRDAATFVSIVPQVPRGVIDAAVQSYDGQAMRVVFQYDSNKKQDLISADAYLTSKLIRPEAVVEMTLPAAQAKAPAGK